MTLMIPPSACDHPRCTQGLGLKYVKRRGMRFCTEKCWTEYKSEHSESFFSTLWQRFSWLRLNSSSVSTKVAPDSRS